MNCRHVLYWLLLALSAGLTLLSILPVADAPVVVYDGAVFIVPLCVFGACLCAWGSLLASSKKRRDYLLAAGLSLLAVWFLCRDLWDLAACYAYYVPG